MYNNKRIMLEIIFIIFAKHEKIMQRGVKMSRLDIATPNRAQTVVEGLYKI